MRWWIVRRSTHASLQDLLDAQRALTTTLENQNGKLVARFVAMEGEMHAMAAALATLERHNEALRKTVARLLREQPRERS